MRQGYPLLDRRTSRDNRRHRKNQKLTTKGTKEHKGAENKLMTQIGSSPVAQPLWGVAFVINDLALM